MRQKFLWRHKRLLHRVTMAAALLAVALVPWGAGERSAVLVMAAGGGSTTGLTKVRVSDRQTASDIEATGLRPLVEYGSFKLYRVSDNTAQQMVQRRSVEIRYDYNLIMLNASPIDTTTGAAAAMRTAVETFTGKRMRLVQFVGPPKPEWYEALVQTGVRVVTYVPSNAYLVYGDATTLAQLQTWAGSANYVQWDGAYQDDYKVHPSARPFNADGSARKLETDLFAIQMVSDFEANTPTIQLINSLKLAPIVNQARELGYLNIIVRIPPDRIRDIASRPDVVSIQPYIVPTPFDERQSQIIAGNLVGDVPSGPGYLAWLASRGFTQAQFTASGFAVDVTDSGVDNGTTSPNHFGLYVNGIRPGTSRVVYNRLEGIANPGSTLQGCDGHGTIDAHIIAGFNDLSGFPHEDDEGFHFGLGVCPFVRVGSSVIFDPDFFTFPDYEDLQSRAYNSGARVSNNSWGANVGGRYTIDSQRYDALVRDAQPAGAAITQAGNQEMVIVFANGNAGPFSSSVGAPATAKNVISVGAAENVHPFGEPDGCGIDDSEADSADDMIFFSSRGPCTDGRKKPDIVAPGTHVSGGVFQISVPGSNGTADPCFDGSGVCGGASDIFFPAGQEFYTVSSGTSHSAPAVAGGAALVRQYFINNAMNPASAAMTKAFLMNSARYLTGAGANDNLWSNSQGMGEMNLGFAFDGTSRFFLDQAPGFKFTASGQQRIFVGNIPDATKPFRATVAWTDAPGSTTGNAFNNDLDLEVTIDGVTYKGNVFTGANSTTGGAADPRNNVESVFLPAGVTGQFTATIRAANINSDGVPNDSDLLDQDFALVIYNAANTESVGLVVESVSISGGNGNGFIDFNECNRLSVLLRNLGSTTVTGVTARISTTTPGLTIALGQASYPDIPAGAALTNRTPFLVSSESDFACGTPADFSITVSTPSGLTFTDSFQFLGNVGNRFDNNFPVVINDLTTVDSLIDVTGIEGSITNVTVSLFITHTFDADLIISLIAPDGTSINLSTQHGGSGDNFGSACVPDTLRTTFSDAAIVPIAQGRPPYIGSFRPDQALAAFNGKSRGQVNGTWRLRIADVIGADAGVLHCWSLTFGACQDGRGQCEILDPDLTGYWTAGFRRFGSQKIVARFSVMNRGKRKNSPTTVLFWHSSDTILDGNDLLLGETAVGGLTRFRPKRLKADSVLPLSVPNVSGKFLIAVVDPNDVVQEANETNNRIVFGPIP